MRYIHKIALTAMMITFSVLITRFMPGVQLGVYRFSLGAIPIVLASLILGPFWGGIVGAFSDILGALLFPVGPFIIWPLLGSTLFGIVPSMLLLLIKKIRHRFPIRFLLYFLMGAIVLFISAFVIFSTSFTYRATMDTEATINFTLYWKIFTPIILVLLGFAIVVALEIFEKKFNSKKDIDYLQITLTEVALIIFITDFIIDVLYGPIWKMIAFGSNLLVNFVVQTVLFVMAVIIKPPLIYYVLRVYYRLRPMDLLD
ncbi:MAG: ECF transporter S component [Bacilli bacterium]